ncbi:hypothetical protein [Roseivirga sp.]|uniref:hypothetical protein n=1 Tax=Roseivirga sp. TaxID=1964215 RepID=UPI002B26C51A|nr:hypothetical protein [Roseivirga sp.]
MKIFSFKADVRTAFNTCKRVLMDLDCEIEIESCEQGIIEAKMPGSLFAYGYNITIKIKNSELHIISETLGIQIIDWGTNKENEDAIAQDIAKLLK